MHQTPFFPTENSRANSGHNSLEIKDRDDLGSRLEYSRTISENINFMLNGDKAQNKLKPFSTVQVIDQPINSVDASTPLQE